MRRWTGWLAGLALVLGFLLAQQAAVEARLAENAAAQEGKNLAYLITRAVEGNHALAQEVAAEQAALKAASPPPPPTAALAAARAAAGLTPVSGPGVVVSMEDAQSPRFPGEPPDFELVHDQYVLHVVALLSAAGARAIAINGQRYVATTAIFCAGPTIRINGVPYGSPFVITAVGPPAAMLAALNQDVDVQGWSELVVLQYHAASSLTIPPYRGPLEFPWAKPARSA
ncbi:MAG: DUF881 domain-containing protein [Firmicutes bacterium]|nr:DUF881 domain-containing protein [Alicyclobacillaceae bacterium]MCL6497780.1 DUF881 domain-containing protein [Bacillota bacterium]